MSTLTDEDLTALLDGVATSYDVPAHGPAEVLSTLAGLPAPVPLVRRSWVQLSAAASVLVAAVVGMAVLAGGGGADDAQLAGSGDSAGSTVKRMADLDSGGSGADQLAPAAAPQAASGGATNLSAGSKAAETPTTGAVAAPAPVGDDSRVVKTGTIALVVDDREVSTTVSAVQRAAKAQGGYIASSTSSEYGETPTGEVTIRVPAARFENLVSAVRGLAEVRTATSSGKDVTAQYADIEAQLRTLRATRERFLVILGQTKTISEILTVQQRVDNVSGQIDRLEGSRKLLESQSDLSTLTVSVSEKDDPVVRVSAHRGGLSQALHDAKDGFVTGIESIIRHSGRALLWLLCLGALAVMAQAAWKVARRRLV